MDTCQHHSRCIKRTHEQAEAICKQTGARLTVLRRKVLEIIWQTHQPIKAYDILAKLHGVASLKPPTVYRTLDFLQKIGLVHKLSSLNAYVGCTHPLAHNACYFLICSHCGDAKECCNTKLHQVINNTATADSFAIKRVTLEISGVCNECTGHNQTHNQTQ